MDARQNRGCLAVDNHENSIGIAGNIDPRVSQRSRGEVGQESAPGLFAVTG